MRIGMFTDRYLPLTDGVTYSIEGAREELEKLGHEVYIFAPNPTIGYKELSKTVIRFPAVKGLFFDDYLTTFFFPPQVVHQIDKLKLDIIHYHTPGQIGLLGAYYALHNNIPLVTTYHTDLYEYVKHYPKVLPGSIALSMLAPFITGGGLQDFRTSLTSLKPEKSVDKWNQKIVELGVTLLHNRCDLVIAPSPKIEKQLKSWHTTSPIVVLPTGIDQLPSTAKGIDNIRNQFGLTLKDQVILFVGRMGNEKNITVLIKAFDAIAKRDPRAKLMLVGTGEDLGQFKEQAAQSPFADRIIFTGRIDRSVLGNAYAAAKVFAFPSIADTQGLVINEAAWAGLPIVVVDKDVTEVVEDGKNGYFARNNARDLSAKITAVLSNPKLWAKFGDRSRELAARFTTSAQTAKLLRLYKEAIEYHDAKLK
jgi:glycosyltransferase involved in cell wall biosynthesis